MADGSISNPNLEKEKSLEELLARAKNHLYQETEEAALQLENNNSRLNNLRKELNYIKNTDWQFENLEKLIGQK